MKLVIGLVVGFGGLALLVVLLNVFLYKPVAMENISAEEFNQC